MTGSFGGTPVQTLSLFFVLLVIAVAAIRLVRVTTWAVRGPASLEGAARLSARAALVAVSTRGLARAAVWLTCAAGAFGLSSAMIMYGDSSELPLRTLVRQHLAALEASAVGLALCVLLFSASLAVDLIASRISRRAAALPAPVIHEAAGESLPLLNLLRRSPGLIALLLVSYVLLDARTETVGVSTGDLSFTFGTLEMLERFWLRIAAVFAIVGALTYLITLLESAILRRRLPR